jgi:hypothetical protein
LAKFVEQLVNQLRRPVQGRVCDAQRRDAVERCPQCERDKVEIVEGNPPVLVRLLEVLDHAPHPCRFEKFIDREHRAGASVHKEQPIRFGMCCSERDICVRTVAESKSKVLDEVQVRRDLISHPAQGEKCCMLQQAMSILKVFIDRGRCPANPAGNGPNRNFIGVTRFCE